MTETEGLLSRIYWTNPNNVLVMAKTYLHLALRNNLGGGTTIKRKDASKLLSLTAFTLCDCMTVDLSLQGNK